MQAQTVTHNAHNLRRTYHGVYVGESTSIAPSDVIVVLPGLYNTGQVLRIKQLFAFHLDNLFFIQPT